jgi:hypothetical protein
MSWEEEHALRLEELTRPGGVESMVRAGRAPWAHRAYIGSVLDSVECFLVYIPPEEAGPENRLVAEDGGIVCYLNESDEVGVPCHTVEVSLEEGKKLLSRIRKEREAMRREVLPGWKKVLEKLLGRRF